MIVRNLETMSRKSKTERNTKETQITTEINLDGSGISNISTGIGFFDHMLDQLSKHSLIDLTIKAEADLHVDPHHCVEDVGITLGIALSKALGNKIGIKRFGYAYAPLDESLSRAVVDLSGRAGCFFRVQFTAEKIGNLDTQVFEEFFRGFCNSASVTLHLENLYGKNAHHQIESTFKAFALALRIAISVDECASDRIPSTKGTL